MFIYEHLQDKQLKRAEEGTAKEAKAKARRDRKSKNATQVVVETTATVSTMRRGQKRKIAALGAKANSLDVGPGPKGKVARVSHVMAAEVTPRTAPCAKMY